MHKFKLTELIKNKFKFIKKNENCPEKKQQQRKGWSKFPQIEMKTSLRVFKVFFVDKKKINRQNP